MCRCEYYSQTFIMAHSCFGKNILCRALKFKQVIFQPATTMSYFVEFICTYARYTNVSIYFNLRLRYRSCTIVQSSVGGRGEGDNNSDTDHVDSGVNDSVQYRKRTKAKVLRWKTYKLSHDPMNYMREVVTLFRPF